MFILTVNTSDEQEARAKEIVNGFGPDDMQDSKSYPFPKRRLFRFIFSDKEKADAAKTALESLPKTRAEIEEGGGMTIRMIGSGPLPPGLPDFLQNLIGQAALDAPEMPHNHGNLDIGDAEGMRRAFEGGCENYMPTYKGRLLDTCEEGGTTETSIKALT